MRSYSRNSGEISWEQLTSWPCSRSRRPRPARGRGRGRRGAGTPPPLGRHPGIAGTALGSSRSSSRPSRRGAPDLEPPAPGHERLGPHHRRVVERRPVLPGDLDDVAKPRRGHERHRAPSPLEQGVGGDRGAVGQRPRPAAPSAARPSRTARPGSSGVDSTLVTVPSAATTSVKVPPVSAPTRMARTVPACGSSGDGPTVVTEAERAERARTQEAEPVRDRAPRRRGPGLVGCGRGRPPGRRPERRGTNPTGGATSSPSTSATTGAPASFTPAPPRRCWRSSAARSSSDGRSGSLQGAAGQRGRHLG